MIYTQSQKRPKNNHKNRGYTLLFAVLVSALVLAIGISILNINKKELLLTIGARDSSAAFYAADGGLECAIYADSKGVFDNGAINAEILSPYCNVSPVVTLQDPPVFIFEAKFGDQGTSCAIVTVDKTPLNNGNPHTIIDSKGYNTGWDIDNSRCNVPSAKKVERALRYSY